MISQEFIDNIWMFSPLDKLLADNTKQKQTFIAAYQRKEILLGLITQHKIDYRKYKKIAIKLTKNQNQLIRNCAIQDISKINDSKDDNSIQEWFKQMIENTGANYDQQTAQYKKYTQPISLQKEKVPNKITGVSMQEVQKSLLRATQSKLQTKLKVQQKPQIDYTEIVSFKAADRLLEEYQGNFEVYENIFDRKAKILSLIEKKEITAVKYKKYLENYLKSIKNEDVLIDTKFQYQALSDFHDGNVQQWFKEIYDQAKETIEEQKRKLAKLRYLAGIRKSENSVKESNKNASEHKRTEIMVPKYSMMKNRGLNIGTIYCFQALGDLINNNLDDPQFVKILEERKSTLISEYQNGVLTAQKYKNLIQSNAKMQDISEDVKDSIRFQLSFINDFHKGNVKEWFQDIIAKNLANPREEFSEHEQLNQINQQNHSANKQQVLGVNSSASRDLKKSAISGSQGNKVQEQKGLNFNSRVQIDISNVSSLELPELKQKEIKEISNLKVIDLLLNQYQSKGNSQCYKSLFERKEQILSQLRTKTINGEGYKRMQQDQIKKLELYAYNPTIKESAIKDLSKLKMNYNDNVNLWLQAIISESGLSIDAQRIHYERIKAQKTSSNQKNQILGIVTESIKMKKKVDSSMRILTFLKAMAVYQSLLYYHKKNKIPYNTHKYLVQFQRMKKSVYDYIYKIQQDKSLDVLNLIDALFPPLNAHIFYAGQLEIYKTKIDTAIFDLKKQIQALNQYTSKIKKSNNAQNLQSVKNQVAKCEQNIKKLSEWPKGLYHAFPQLKYEKIKKINIDLNKLAPNQIEVTVNNIQGLGAEHILNVYFFSFNQTKHSFIVNDGPIINVRIIENLNQDQINSVFKGNQKYIAFKVYQKGFFGGLTLIGQQSIEPRFYRVNTIDERVQIGNISINYVVKVQKPKNPMETEIQHVSVTMYPQYEYSTFIEQQLIKKFVPYCNPSPSEIAG